jgi:hypothetical protein|tara:strand:+ start:64 stop:2796 length:2733 start_codon:yes stop_codon:yes gene_type:complete
MSFGGEMLTPGIAPTLDAAEIAKLSNEELRALTVGLVEKLDADSKEWQLRYYEPASPRAFRVHETTAKKVGVSGGNGCLPLHAPILMANGEWRELGDIEVGDQVIAVDPETGTANPAPVTGAWRSGIKPVYWVKFSDGGSFQATAEHMVPLYLGSGRKTTKGHPKKPLKRRLGDYIEPIMRRGGANPSKRISAISAKDIQFVGGGELPLDPYLMGALLGDGGMSAKSLKFSNADEAVLDRVRAHVEAMGLRLVKYQGYDYGISGTPGVRPHPAIDALRKLGLWGKTSHHKFIPPIYLAAPRADRMELLAGLIDTDGTVDWYMTVSPRLATDVVTLVRSLGGKATLKKRRQLVQNGSICESWAIYIRLNDRIPLSVPRKQVAGHSRTIDYTRRVCRSAELVGFSECGDIEVGHPGHCYITGDWVVVSNSSKTESCIVDIISLATGVFPTSIADLQRPKFRGPVNCRIVVESLTNTLYPIILPKLQWNRWTGIDAPGGARGHWGWVPRACLIDGDWDRSFLAKTRELRVLCRDPDDVHHVIGESVIQFLSHDNEPEDFASGDFHHILLDEPTTAPIYRECEARTMRVGGRILLAMTWPDDPAAPVDWIYDELYERGQGTGKVEGVEWMELLTTENRTLDQDAIRAQMKLWSQEMISVRIEGKPIRFANLVHKEFTDEPRWWCFTCNDVVASIEVLACPTCGGSDLEEYCHVADVPFHASWPCYWLLDPHPRKPHFCAWVMVDPNDDLYWIAEAEVDGDADDVRENNERIERELGLVNVCRWLGDPRMLGSPTPDRDRNWRDIFNEAGVPVESADPSEVGRRTLDTYLRPDPYMRRPRLIFHPRCIGSIHQFKRYSWDEFKIARDREPKQKPRDKHDDYPALGRYLMNDAPEFDNLMGAAGSLRRPGTRRGAY